MFWCKAKPEQDLMCTHCNSTWNRVAINAASAASRACPNCGLMITRYHGHGCHHIAPSGGCPKCHQHFCYICERKHGTPGTFEYNRECPHGSSFCRSDDLLASLVKTPFLYDKRCGCAVCPICQPG